MGVVRWLVVVAFAFLVFDAKAWGRGKLYQCPKDRSSLYSWRRENDEKFSRSSCEEELYGVCILSYSEMNKSIGYLCFCFDGSSKGDSAPGFESGVEIPPTKEELCEICDNVVLRGEGCPLAEPGPDMVECTNPYGSCTYTKEREAACECMNGATFEQMDEGTSILTKYQMKVSCENALGECRPMVETDTGGEESESTSASEEETTSTGEETSSSTSDMTSSGETSSGDGSTVDTMTSSTGTSSGDTKTNSDDDSQAADDSGSCACTSIRTSSWGSMAWLLLFPMTYRGIRRRCYGAEMP